MRTTSDFLFATRSMKPGSWWENPLWSWRQTWEVSRKFSEAIGLRHGTSAAVFNHLACWLTIESTMWIKAS
ncbi:hypothetical protein D3C76_1063620 [compost metagenome]